MLWLNADIEGVDMVWIVLDNEGHILSVHNSRTSAEYAGEHYHYPLDFVVEMWVVDEEK